ncbi:MAG: hypothetical protein D6707_09990, partial [Bacteroidetes bacterium]
TRIYKSISGKIKPELDRHDIILNKGQSFQQDISVMVSETQFFIAGTTIDVNFYKIKDQTFLRLKLINKRSEGLVVNPSDIYIEIAGKRYLTEKVNDKPISKKDIYVMEPNARLELLLKYKTQGNDKNAMLYLRGITDEKKQSFIPFPLEYSHKGKGVLE